MPADHPWTAKKTIDTALLNDKSLLLLGEGHCFRDQVLEACPSLRKGGGSDAAEVMTVAACKMKSRSRAESALKQVKLFRRPAVKSQCRSAGVTMGLLVQADMATPVISDLGSKEQIEEFLTPALRGEKIACLGVSEPNAGSDVAGIQTWAKKDGDDYIINGAKTYITNGTRADFVTLLVKTNPEAGAHGCSFFTPLM